MAFGVLQANFVASLAQKYYNLSEWSKAAEMCEKMLKMKPKNPNHYMMLGDVYIRIPNLSRGKEVFTQMSVLFKDNEQIVKQVSFLVIEWKMKGTKEKRICIFLLL